MASCFNLYFSLTTNRFEPFGLLLLAFYISFSVAYVFNPFPFPIGVLLFFLSTCLTSLYNSYIILCQFVTLYPQFVVLLMLFQRCKFKIFTSLNWSLFPYNFFYCFYVQKVLFQSQNKQAFDSVDIYFGVW